MANYPVIVSVRVIDADGEVFSFPVYGFSPDTATITQMVSAVQGLAGVVDAILDGQITKLGVSIDFPLPGGLKSSPVAGSEIERTGLIPFYVTGSVYKQAVDLPAFKYSKFLTGTNKINMADTDVAAFTSYMIASSPNLNWSDKYGHLLNVAAEGGKTFRKHRRQTKRT